ncbi:MAG: proline--tRNA ligase, partial [Chloroflexi bacterium]|nr:proline--tRNA ligase [Chloroflexota bacterium]
SGRWYSIGDEMSRFRDRNDHEMVLAMTHEEAVGAVVRNVIQSYRQLPALIYQIQLKWRDDPRPRAGLIRTREFTMLDSYSLDRDEAGLDQQYRAHYRAYRRIFERCELPVMAVLSDSGMMGGGYSHEFMYLSPIGEDSILICPACGYAANRQIATFQKERSQNEAMLDRQKVFTPQKKTIAELAAFLEISPTRTAKAIFLMAEIDEGWQLVQTVIRGDRELNEAKLSHIIRSSRLRPATEEEILASGAVPGYASPIGVRNTLVVCDDELPALRNLAAGANEREHHFLNVNYGRDFEADIIADIVCAEEGSPCPQCGKAMHSRRGIEVANIFKLGTFYLQKMNLTYLDEKGSSRPIVMGSYGLGLGRLLACIAEEHHDERGLSLPASVAPYPLHLIHIRDREEKTKQVAEELYAELQQAGLAVLYDDREISAGVKFNDADLLGMPYRLTVSSRSLSNGGIEIKSRVDDDIKIIERRHVLAHLKDLKFDLQS